MLCCCQGDWVWWDASRQPPLHMVRTYRKLGLPHSSGKACRGSFLFYSVRVSRESGWPFQSPLNWLSFLGFSNPHSFLSFDTLGFLFGPTLCSGHSSHLGSVLSWKVWVKPASLLYFRFILQYWTVPTKAVLTLFINLGEKNAILFNKNRKRLETLSLWLKHRSVR